MIEYSYRIERNEGNETKIYVPGKIPTTLPNLVYIEGPNSSGKSTLLNILALSMHGLGNGNINSALRDKMKTLVDSKHQRLKFDVKITNKDNTFEIVSRKEDAERPEIVVHENKNGKETILTPERLEREYNLIYDIPYNPTERLNQLAHAIKEDQLIYGNRIARLKDHVLHVIGEIKDSRDPNQLSYLKEQLDKVQKGCEKLKEADRKFEFYRIECTKRNIDEENLDNALSEIKKAEELKPYFVYTEEQLNDKISDLKNRILTDGEDLKTKGNWMQNYEDDIKKLEKKEPHKYYNRLEDLKDILDLSLN